jgi:integrase
MSKRRARGEGSLIQQPDGLWVGRIDVPSTNGKRRRAKVTSMKYDEAVRKFNKLRREVEDGTYAASGNTTVTKWCDYWLDNIVKPRVRPNTFRYYEEAVRLHIAPNIGKVRLSKLTQRHVREMQAAIQATGSTRNAVKAHQSLQKALTDAVREGLLARNVAELVDRPKHLTRSYGALSPDAARHLVNTAVDRGDPLASRWCAGFYTGARPAELLGLTWEHVDLEAGVIELAWQLQNHKRVHDCGPMQIGGEPMYPCGRRRPSACPKATWELPAGFDYRETEGSLLLTRPKTKAGWRQVPLAGPLLAMLRAHRAATAGQPNPHDLVWHAGGKPISHRDDHHAWVAAAEASGLARRKYLPPVAADPGGDVLLTTQDVADALQVSRPTVVKHMEAGRLPFEERQGRWRYVKLADLLASDLELDQASLDAVCERRAGVRTRGAARAATHGKVEWEVRPPAPYVSRHTMATLLQDAGVPEDVRMLIMGHSSIVAHRGYLHGGAAPKREAIAALEAVYETGT